MSPDEHGGRPGPAADDMDPELRARLEAPLAQDETWLSTWVAGQRAAGPRPLPADRLAVLKNMDDGCRVSPEASREPGE